ncbi:MAG: hypothetical protein A3D40_02090 [Parcubacteria group bacterium RIFCSPHIGHO2_02_FULL_40_12]|nr:MAG: hypothetical protein A3D40_02090 [Parcubacteria group bacterium RIFCSPHIGHO2_02_FULL_40_12]
MVSKNLKGKTVQVIFISVLIVIGLFLVFYPDKKIEIWNKNSSRETLIAIDEESTKALTTRTTVNQFFPPDIEFQKQLDDPPKAVKAIYLTGWSGGNEAKIKQVINLARTGKINAVVIDIKDFSGKISYNTSVKETGEYGAEEAKIPRINTLIKRLHDEKIYVIARQAVFQDQVLAISKPELAVKSVKLSQVATVSQDNSEGKPSASYGASIWRDYKGLAWIDPAASESWNYNIKIAKDAWSHGFDEINFDYIRFPTDGDLNDRLFPFWDGKRLMGLVMRDFYKEIRRQMPDARLSIDLFGLAAVTFYDFGVGQMIEDAFEFFDFVSPMLYPSHFPLTFLSGSPTEERKPAEYPYEVVRKSMDTALIRLRNSGSNSSLRPWLQDFDLGADYDAEKVKAQIQAVIDSFGEEGSDDYRGFMLWNPVNVYTEDAL